MHIRLVFTIILAVISLYAQGQNTLTKEANAMRDNDRMSYMTFVPCTTGNAGNSEIWDFSQAAIQKSSNNVYFSADSLSHIFMTDNYGKLYFKMINDSLKIYKYENRLTKINYFKNKLAVRYPFMYGDSISSTFEGFGFYCSDHYIRVRGQVNVQADGCGKLILPDNDTINNVLRISTITSTAMAMDIDFATIDSTNLKQEIEEKHEWYGMGYRYPLCTIIQRTSYSDMEPIGTNQTAYILLPEDFKYLDDAVNDSIKNEQAEKEKEERRNHDIFHFNINKLTGKVDIIYNVDSDANVTIILSNYSGMLYETKHYTLKGGDTGHIYVNTSGLLPGKYVIYINVNGKVYSKTLNLA